MLCLLELVQKTTNLEGAMSLESSYWPFHHLRQFFTMDKLAQDVKALTLRVAVLESARKGALKVNLHKDYVIAST